MLDPNGDIARAGMWMNFQSRAQPKGPAKPVAANEVHAFSMQARAGPQFSGVNPWWPVKGQHAGILHPSKSWACSGELTARR